MSKVQMSGSSRKAYVKPELTKHQPLRTVTLAANAAGVCTKCKAVVGQACK